MIGIITIKRDQLLPYDEGRRQYDIQEQVSKITSCIEAILSTNNPGAAGKFYTTDYVLVPADLLILRGTLGSSVTYWRTYQIWIDALKLNLTPCFTQRLVIRYEEKSILNRLMKILLQVLM